MRQPDQELLRLLVENVTDYAIFVLDRDGNVASWNPGAARIKGYTADEIIGRHFSVFYPQDALDRGWPAHELEVARAQGRFEDEGWRIRKDGSRFWANVVITALRDEQGSLRGFAKITRDLTARKDAEENGRRLAEETAARTVAHEERERLRVTMASIGDAVVSTDARGHVEFLNPIAERLTGWSARDAAGRALEEIFVIVNETTRRPAENPALRALKEGVIVGLANHTVLLANDGVERPIDDSAAPIRTAQGDIVGSVLVFRDISERRRAERHRSVRLAVAQQLSVATTAREGTEGVLDAMCQHLEWDAGYLWVDDEAQAALICHAGRHRDGARTSAAHEACLKQTFRPGEGLPGQVWSTGEPAQGTNVASDLPVSFACPVRVDQRFVGVLELFARRADPLGPDLLETAGTVAATLGQFLDRCRAEDSRREQTTRAETLLRVSRLLAEELDLQRLVQTVTDECTRLCGAQLGAFFYNVVDDRGEAYTLYTLSGAPRAAFENFPMPRNTAVFGPTFRGEGVVRLDDVTRDPRYGQSAPYHGMPKGHPAVRSYLAVPVVSRTGEVLGGLFFGHPETGVFKASHEGLLVGIAGQAAVAIDNARLHQRTQASEERLRLALEAGRMGVWDWNVRTGQLSWSDSLEPLHGLASGTFGGTFAHFRELIHPDDRAAVDAAIQRALAGEDEFYVEFRNPRPDGAVHWIAGSGRVFRGDDGQPLRMIGIGLDVTRRLRAEQTARFLADASGALAGLVDFDSTLQKVASLAVPRFADAASVDVLGDDGSLRRVGVAQLDPARPLPSLDGVWNILRTGQPELVRGSSIGVPLVVRGKTIGVFTFLAAAPGQTYDATDLAIATDLANRAAIAVENAQLYGELREADRRKDEFLATLAHELRNPLAPIQNGLNVLGLAGGGGDVVTEARAMMERQLTHMVRLVDDLMDVSRITRNKLELRKERVDLATVIHSAIETSRPLMEKAGHAFTVKLAPTPIWLDADPVRLAQVFSNLLNNAAKYTEPGGTITLTAEADADAARVIVRDDGLGLPADALPRIFDMFSQVERNVGRAQGGLGIGLTLVRRLTELHGGHVQASSDGPGRGSAFTVRLPLPAAVGEHARRGADKEWPATQTRHRMLIVDDNSDAADTLGMLLELMGHEVQTAPNGLAALALAETHRPEVILLDIGLPGIDGYETCRRLRTQAGAKDAIIVALTGWGQEEDRRRSREAGFDHHLVKPLDVAHLKQILASVRR